MLITVNVYYNIIIVCLVIFQDLVGRLSLDEMVAQMSHGGAENNGQARPLSGHLGQRD